MNGHRLLIGLTSLLIVSGLIFSLLPFVLALEPNSVAASRVEVRIPLSSITKGEVLEVDYLGDKVFIVKLDKISAFKMPFSNGAYHLPDPTWNRAVIPCQQFVANQEGFSCEDPTLPYSHDKEASWDIQGKRQGNWMPDLQKINFIIEDDHFILNPKFG